MMGRRIPGPSLWRPVPVSSRRPDFSCAAARPKRPTPDCGEKRDPDEWNFPGHRRNTRMCMVRSPARKADPEEKSSDVAGLPSRLYPSKTFPQLNNRK